MIRICCSKFHEGDKVFGEKPPYKNKEETHGFCEECFLKELDSIKKQQDETKLKPPE